MSNPLKYVFKRTRCIMESTLNRLRPKFETKKYWSVSRLLLHSLLTKNLKFYSCFFFFFKLFHLIQAECMQACMRINVAGFCGIKLFTARDFSDTVPNWKKKKKWTKVVCSATRAPEMYLQPFLYYSSNIFNLCCTRSKLKSYFLYFFLLL